ncbi:MAG: sulfotransferase [Anaerolineae bacterium]|nr:sulfotransferase [Anaerolineae bacterium]
MGSKILNILNKADEMASPIVTLDSFTYTEGAAVEPQIIMNNPSISLYCLDDKNRRAIFVETPSDVDLSQFPFYYYAQLEYAQRLIAVPYEELFNITQGINDAPLIFIYSVSRCGSTLLSKIFNQVDTVLSLSEPGVFTQIVGLREPNGHRDNELIKLLHSCVSTFCKPSQYKTPTTWAIKFYFCIEIADLMFKTYPDAKSIFLYRNIETWATSYAQAFGVFNSDVITGMYHSPEIALRYFPILENYFNCPTDDSKSIDLMALMWISITQRYLKLQQQGYPIQAVRYEDLITRPAETISAIFTQCDLPTDRLTEVMRVLEQDSQRDSHYAQDQLKTHPKDRLNEVHFARIRELLHTHLGAEPGIIFPGTLNLGN